jgi:hypothetical protein
VVGAEAGGVVPELPAGPVHVADGEAECRVERGADEPGELGGSVSSNASSSLNGGLGGAGVREHAAGKLGVAVRETREDAAVHEAVDRGSRGAGLERLVEQGAHLLVLCVLCAHARIFPANSAVLILQHRRSHVAGNTSAGAVLHSAGRHALRFERWPPCFRAVRPAGEARALLCDRPQLFGCAPLLMPLCLIAPT